MSRLVHLRLSRAWFPFLLLSACVLCVLGCHNVCVSGVLNSPGGSTVNVKVSSPPPSCMLSTANGAVHLRIGAVPEPTSVLDTIHPQITHLFVTLAGVDAHPSTLASDAAPGWVSLATSLQARPLQVDLLADPNASGFFSQFPDAFLPAGVYHQIRLRVENTLPEQSVLDGNRCGAGSLHCAVTSDGRIQPFSFSSSAPFLRTSSESLPGHEFYVPPEGAVTVTIELDQDHSWFWSSGDSLFLTPVFHLNVQQQLAGFLAADPVLSGDLRSLHQNAVSLDGLPKK